MTTPIQLQPIGTVSVKQGRFFLQLQPDFHQALTNIEGFSHLHVLYWANYCDAPAHRSCITADRPYVDGPEVVGVFATRSEYRPNPILMSIVPVLHVDREQGLVEVGYIDAFDGSPLLDLKPYLPSVDRVRDVTQAAWAEGWPKWYEDSARFNWDAVFTF